MSRMSFQEVKEQAVNLSVSERLALVSAIIESLRDISSAGDNRSSAIARLRGALRTEQPAPNDDAVAELLEARRMEKYHS